MDDSQGRLLNVSLLAGSRAHRAYYDRSESSASELTEDELAAGFPPRPELNLRYFGGKTIAHLVFANHYLGGSASWAQADIARLGWYSAKGGEIGDIPVKEAGTSLALVFREVDLADGSGAVPVQLMWSNKAEAPAPRVA
jgi:hypothetical protein